MDGLTGIPRPMFPTRTDRSFSDEKWVFERKLDGIRALSTRDGWRPRLWGRDRRSLDTCFPELVEALAELGGTRFVADGEIVAFDGHATSYSRLQARLQRARPAASDVDVYYFLFDLLSLDDTDVTRWPLRQRKRLLRGAFRFRDPLRYHEHRDHNGEAYFQQACLLGWEGVVAKRADSRYRGGRTGDWLAVKRVRDQEFVVGGFTEPQGARVGFGALLIGYQDGDRLRYAGKVGTGYDNATLRSLRSHLDGMAQVACPFADAVGEPTVHWVRPELVVQVGFAEWTGHGRLRLPRFIGIRTDKPATDVVRETR